MAGLATPLAELMKDQYRTYEIGAPVLIWLGDHGGEMTEGRVIHSFIPTGEAAVLYVIEIEHELGSNYECRSGHKLCMRPSKGSTEYDSWAAA